MDGGKNVRRLFAHAKSPLKHYGTLTLSLVLLVYSTRKAKSLPQRKPSVLHCRLRPARRGQSRPIYGRKGLGGLRPSRRQKQFNFAGFFLGRFVLLLNGKESAFCRAFFCFQGINGFSFSHSARSIVCKKTTGAFACRKRGHSARRRKKYCPGGKACNA
jgi:hypothetical protein